MTFDLINRNRIGKGKVYNSSFSNKDMEETNPIIDYLKSLEGIDHKKIRKEYVMGEDLAKIIAGYNTEKSDAITKVFDLIKFEFDEQERFLKTYEGIEEVGLFFYPLTEQIHSSIIVITLKGMKEGVQDFLNRENLITVYSPRLSYFCYDDTLKNSVEKKVDSLDLKLRRRNVPGYAEDIMRRYNSFLANESSEEFDKRFGKK